MTAGQDDHLVGLLLFSDSGAGSGSYNSFDRWSTALRGGKAGSPGARLVTVHEALHVALNDTTAVGVMLAACAALARTGQDGLTAVLRGLVDGCRGLHEAYATFESLWLVVNGELAYLDGYPSYQRHPT